MKILFICNEYPPGRSGGIGTATRNLAVALTEQGHSVFVAGLYPPGFGAPDFEVQNGIAVWRKRNRFDYRFLQTGGIKTQFFHWALRKSGLMHLDTRYSLKAFVDFVDALVQEHDIDLIEWPDFNDWFSYADPRDVADILQVPIVIKLHGTNSYIRHQLGEKLKRREFEREGKHLRQAAAIVAVSVHTAAHNSKFYSLDREIPVLYNSMPVPAEKSRIVTRQPVVIYFGTLTFSKGVGSLMQAWEQVIKKMPHVRLVLFGKGNDKPFQKLLSREAQRSVRFHGFATQEQIRERLETAAAAVFPSFSECFSLAPMEAMACGCPVIYTQRSSGSELITHGVDGYLVEPANPNEIANAILKMLSEPQYAADLGSKGRETIETRFCPAEIARQHLAFYQEVIDSYQVANA